jgi:hypothetical protein
MAKIRRLKKDIEFITFEVVSDCFSALELYPDRKKTEIYTIISDAVNNGNDLMEKVNQKNLGDKKETKKHYKGIYTDLLKGADDQFSRLSKIISEK